MLLFWSEAKPSSALFEYLEHLAPLCKPMYLSELQNVFVQIAKCICSNCKMYLSVSEAKSSSALFEYLEHLAPLGKLNKASFSDLKPFLLLIEYFVIGHIIWLCFYSRCLSWPLLAEFIQLVRAKTKAGLREQSFYFQAGDNGWWWLCSGQKWR